MPGALLLVLLGSLTVTQVLFGEAFERLNVKAAITGAGSSSSTHPSSDTSGGAAIVPAAQIAPPANPGQGVVLA